MNTYTNSRTPNEIQRRPPTRLDRPKARLLAAMVALALAGLTLFGCVGDRRTPQEKTVFDRTNWTRGSLGLAALAYDDTLESKAQAWARAMADAHRIYHSDPTTGVPAGWHTLGENVGFAASPDALYQGWLNSPGHYANIIDRRFTRLAVGIVQGSDGYYYGVEEFWG